MQSLLTKLWSLMKLLEPRSRRLSVRKLRDSDRKESVLTAEEYKRACREGKIIEWDEEVELEDGVYKIEVKL